MTMTPREPEIEFLGKVVRAGLLFLRGMLWLASAVAIVIAAIQIVCEPAPPRAMEGITRDVPLPTSVAIRFTQYVVWFCIAVPPLLPIGWLFGRGRWLMLAIGAVFWFGPMWLPGDHEYGWLLRFFATVVALSVLFVWKTIYALTQKNAPPA